MCPCHPDNGEFFYALLASGVVLIGMTLLRRNWTKMGLGLRVGGISSLTLLVGALGYALYFNANALANRQESGTSPCCVVAIPPASRPSDAELPVNDAVMPEEASTAKAVPGETAGAATTSAADAVPTPAFDVKVIAYYFHRTMRCYACQTIEDLSKEAIEQFFFGEIASGLLEYRAVNTEEPEYSHFEDDYELTVQSLVLVRIENGEVTEWKNLEKIWDLFEDYGAFAEYVQGEVTRYLYPSDIAADAGTSEN